MKIFNLLSISAVFILSIFLTGSCGLIESCPATNCNTGTLNEETCECDCLEGYEGTDCTTLWRTKMIASYNVSEVCTSGSDSYASTAEVSATDELSIEFTNFYNSFANKVTAKATSSNTFTIDAQEPDSDGISVSGTGTIATDGILTVSFTLTDGSNNDSCTGTFTPM